MRALPVYRRPTTGNRRHLQRIGRYGGALLMLASQIVCSAAPVQEEDPRPTSPTYLMLNPADQHDQWRYDDILEEHLEPSYVTLLGGYDFKKRGEYDDMYYEAELYQHLRWWSTKPKGDSGSNLRLYIPVRVQVRQFRRESSPVQTPSFNPGIRLYYWPGAWEGASFFHYLSLGMHHYSNGQSGPHYRDDGSVNTESGSFSSDYYELAYHYAGTRMLQGWQRVSLRHYLTKLTWEKEQTGVYETTVLRYEHHTPRLGTLPLLNPLPPFRLVPADSALQFDIAYKFGRDYIYDNPVSGERKPAGTADNVQWHLAWILSPQNWDDLSWYLRYDHGYDNYNINYERPMHRLQLGLVTHNFR